MVARSRAEAEDACELVEVDYEELPAVTDRGNRARPRHSGDPLPLGDNPASSARWIVGEPDKAFAEADAVVETTFVFGRHTGVTNEPRAIVADWNRATSA